MNEVRSLLRMLCMLLEYSFERRPNGCACSTVGPVMIIQRLDAIQLDRSFHPLDQEEDKRRLCSHGEGTGDCFLLSFPFPPPPPSSSTPLLTIKVNVYEVLTYLWITKWLLLIDRSVIAQFSCPTQQKISIFRMLVGSRACGRGVAAIW